jgi:hypothetical protein
MMRIPIEEDRGKARKLDPGPNRELLVAGPLRVSLEQVKQAGRIKMPIPVDERITASPVG